MSITRAKAKAKAKAKAGAVQLLNGADSKSGFQLNLKELEKILLADHVKDTLVSVVSVAGAYRKGKSFLLSFILRYLESVYEMKNTSNWLGNDDTRLEGFSWRGGDERNTTGILIWSKIYQHTLENGQTISIILIDTQGTFDSESSVQECVTIFALSTMISSVQIYNIFNNIQEDDLHNLQMFMEYGKIAKTSNNQKPFQKLQFLIRDFGFGSKYGLGAVGGKSFLKQKFQISERQPQEVKDIRREINSYFDAIDCFLMPFPGKIVQKEEFKGYLNEIDDDFKECLKEFIPLIVGPYNLTPKKINGACIKAKDLLLYIQEYVDVFDSDKIPSACSLFETTVKVNCMTAIEKSRSYYHQRMELEYSSSKKYIPLPQLMNRHDQYVKCVIEMFDDNTKFGNEKQRRPYRNALCTEVDKCLNFYIAKNKSLRSENLEKMIENLNNEMADKKKLNALKKVMGICADALSTTVGVVTGVADGAVVGTVDAAMNIVVATVDGATSVVKKSFQFFKSGSRKLF